MTEIKKIEIVNHDEERQAGYVTLPYDRSDFNEFIKSLLGKPQTLEGEFRGSYSLDKGDIINLHHLIEQRVQQNESTLVSLVIQIVYNDDSSITLTDLDSFRTYNELRPIIPIAIHLTWIYLIRFHDKNAPEKQVINISIGSSENSEDLRRLHRYNFRNDELCARGVVSYGIENTNRSWSVDIENLLRNHFSNILKGHSKWYLYIFNRDWDVITLIAFIVLSLVSSFFAIQKMKIELRLEYENVSSNNSLGGIDAISAKMDWMSNTFSSGLWAYFYFGIIVFIVASIFVSIPIGDYLERISLHSKSSYLLFTGASRDKKTEIEKREKKSFRNLAITAFLSVLSGIIANVIFAKYFSELFR